MADTKGRVLITGVSGFIGKHLAREFLEHGYQVRGTVRAMPKAERVRETLARYVDVSGLEFAQADLLADSGWEEAVDGVDHVVHVASPFPIVQPKDPAVLVRPAVEGTMRVLKIAAAAGVSTFVQTSSTAAIYPGHGNQRKPYTPEDWANLDSAAATPYVRSKTLAERTARDHVAEAKPALRFVSVNPGFVVGPLLDAEKGSSADVIAMMLRGRMPGIPRLHMAIVDVRDVAAVHRLAVEKGKHEGRYIASAGSLWMRQMAAALKSGLGRDARKVPTTQLPDGLLKFVAFFNPSARAIVPALGLPVNMDVSATVRDLGATFIAPDEAVVAMGKSLVELGCV